MHSNQNSSQFEHFTVNFSLSSTLKDDIENYLIAIEGQILSLDEYSEVEMEIGTIKGFYVDIANAWEDRFEPFDILDLEGSTAPYYDALFDYDTKEFKETFGFDIIYSNILIIDRLEIWPSYRNRMVGLMATHRMIQQFSHGCGLVAIKVFPLQFEAKRDDEKSKKWFSDMELGSFEQEEATAVEKLKRYYQQLGFVEVENSSFMVLSTILKRPSLHDLGFDG